VMPNIVTVEKKSGKGKVKVVVPIPVPISIIDKFVSMGPELYSGGLLTQIPSEIPVASKSLVPSVSTREVAVAKVAAQQAFDPVLVQECREIKIVTVENYQAADLLLGRLRTCNKIVKEMIEEKLDIIIKPIRAGLDLLYAERRGLQEPGEKAEKLLKDKMGKWQVEDRARIAREAEGQRQQALSDARRARELVEQAERAGGQDNMLSAVAEEARLTAQVSAQEYRQASEVVPVRGSNSSSRFKQKVRVGDMTALLAAIVETAGQDDAVPEALIQVNQAVLDAYFASDRGLTLTWPGVEIYEDVSVARRRG
jgi:hypothetical protein